MLVEGPTEVQTIQQFLRLYGKDHQIVLLPLGGSSLINAKVGSQLHEIKRISNNVSALIDSERSAPDEPLSEDRAAFVQKCEKAKVPCKVLDLRAIENYFTDSTIKQVKGKKYRALGSYETLKDASLAWAKSENWRIAREMTREDLQTTDLGQFIYYLEVSS